MVMRFVVDYIVSVIAYLGLLNELHYGHSIFGGLKEHSMETPDGWSIDM